jgi:O-antigen ligase
MRLSAIGKHPTVRRTTDWVMKIGPVAGLVVVLSYIAAQQAVSPQRRMIKLAVLVALMSLMLRFDMVYSVYLFTLLFPFPSGVALGSTNSILMTVIPLIWAVRAASTKSKLFLRKSRVDIPIVLFLFAYVLSFFNVETSKELSESLRVLWRTVASIMYFYMVVTFVNDEKKVILLTKVACGVCALVMVTAVIELFFPGAKIIPGWIGLASNVGEGKFGYRVQGVRVGGVFASHGMLSDFGTQMFFLMVYHVVRSRNPIEKTIWGAVTLLTVAAVVATANRGAFVGFVVGLGYLLYLFRGRLSVTRLAFVAAAVASMFVAAELVLTRYTYAVSLTDRLTGTTFEGIIPETRTMTWKPALAKSLDHPFIGHGPYYDTGVGLTSQFWPHNSFIFYFYTIGVLGLLAYLAIVFRVWQYSKSYLIPEARGTPLSDISKILRVILTVFLVEQMRTDHQRDDIYPYIMWMVFGLVTATALVIREKYQGGQTGERGPWPTNGRSGTPGRHNGPIGPSASRPDGRPGGRPGGRLHT